VKRLKVGVVGLGYLGRFHAQKYAAMDRAELVGLADLDLDRARAAGQEVGAPAFGRVRDLMGRVEAVSVVVPAKDHFQVARQMLDQGVHCLVEKPLAVSLDQADELVQLAEDKGLVLQVGHLERFNPVVTALQQVLDRPLFFEARRLTPLIDRGRDVDVVLDLMIHDIDILLSLLGEPPAVVESLGTAIVSAGPDAAQARLKFPSGCLASLTAARISSDPCRQIQIFQAGSHLMADCAGRSLTIFSRDRALGRGRGQAEEVRPGVWTRRLTFPQTDPLAEELAAFVDTVRQGGQPLVSGRDGRRALAVALDIGARMVSEQGHGG